MELCYQRQGITPFLVMEVLEEAQRLERAGHDIAHLEIGEPDFDTPICVRRAAEEALAAGDTHYTHSLGVLALREAICDHYRERYRVAVEPDQVIVTSGTSPALCLLFAALLQPGDEVILTNPHYACYPNFVRFACGKPVFVPTGAADAFQVDASTVRKLITKRTKAILVNTPANPTGASLSPETLAALADLGPLLISDEIYHGLTYEGEERSALEFGSIEQVCVLNGFSKAYAMTGWRLGYAIASREIVKAMQPLHQNFFISASAFVQRAGIAALREAGPDAARMREEYARRRLHLIRRLSEIGLDLGYVPQGAFYALVDLRRYTSDSLSFAFDLLRNAHVAVTPGIDFGSGAEGHVRLSYATSIDRIDVGVQRLGEYLSALPSSV